MIGHNGPAPSETSKFLAARLSRVGLLEWFHLGQRERVEQALRDCSRLGVRRMRTGISWADAWRDGGRKWIDWLIPRLASEVELLPCFLYTPPSLGVQPRVAAPPRRLRDYADFLDSIIQKHGQHFQYVELWNEPNNACEWDVTLDPHWFGLCEMLGDAAHWARRCGKKTVLGGLSPIDPSWLHLMFHRGLMEHIDVIGVHGFPTSFTPNWTGWGDAVGAIRQVLDHYEHQGEVWITETGCSTWRHQVRAQVREFLHAVAAPAQRVYWYSLRDLPPEESAQTGFHQDEREYHFGLRDDRGQEKLLYRLWSGGAATLAASRPLLRAARFNGWSGGDRPVLITGGAGFIGSNLADRLLTQGRRVVLYDNLSRLGVEENLRWLRARHGPRIQIELGDVRDAMLLRRCVQGASEVVHLAAQVAVTTSLTGPGEDFEVNARGTVNLLEAIRRCPHPPPLLFTSTNKVYGALSDVPLRPWNRRYEPIDTELRRHGIGENRPLDFHSPYGCSKGSADQYVLDYSRTFGLRTVVFRMSCIYGPHQFGTEDQGWIAHFLIRAMEGHPICLYGDGQQVRDVLFVHDLLEAMQMVLSKVDGLAGRAFNVGGGPGNAISLLELLDLIEALEGKRPEVSFRDWRTGDQRYYVSNCAALCAATGWRPKVHVRDGVAMLHEWLLGCRQAPSAARQNRPGWPHTRKAAESYLREVQP